MKLYCKTHRGEKKEICILMVKKQLMKKCDIVTAKEDITK